MYTGAFNNTFNMLIQRSQRHSQVGDHQQTILSHPTAERSEQSGVPTTNPRTLYSDTSQLPFAQDIRSESAIVHNMLPVPSLNSSGSPGLITRGKKRKGVHSPNGGQKKRAKGEEDHGPRFMCPFAANDPFENFGCRTLTLSRFSAVTQHIDRQHTVDDVNTICSNCWEQFDDALLRDSHAENCRDMRPRRSDLISSDDLEGIKKSLPSRMDEQTKCHTLYKRLYPDQIAPQLLYIDKAQYIKGLDDLVAEHKFKKEFPGHYQELLDINLKHSDKSGFWSVLFVLLSMILQIDDTISDTTSGTAHAEKPQWYQYVSNANKSHSITDPTCTPDPMSHVDYLEQLERISAPYNCMEMGPSGNYQVIGAPNQHAFIGFQANDTNVHRYGSNMPQSTALNDNTLYDMGQTGSDLWTRGFVQNSTKVHFYNRYLAETRLNNQSSIV